MNKKELYLKAKKAYYLGEPILSDTEFDYLENELKESGQLKDIQQVGFHDENRNAKFKHPTRMLSLSKFQADGNDNPCFIEVNKWLSKRSQSKIYEATPKFDGNAVNIIYRNGKLDAILSRGDGDAGRDYTEKLINNVPNKIKTKHKIVEVRGEVVIPIDKFNQYNEKYDNEYKNERNFVAGILNRDVDETGIISEFVFMAVEAKAIENSEVVYLPTEILSKFGFNHKYSLYTIYFQKNEFIETYQKMLHHRKVDCPFRLDGFVIKTDINTRRELGENDHDPEWAVAIKFPPEEAVTKVIDIEWNFGKTGNLTPVAILEPTLLDGTTVQRASVHNLGWLIEKDCLPGTTVTIAKKGDIIPQIINILK